MRLSVEVTQSFAKCYTLSILFRSQKATTHTLNYELKKLTPEIKKELAQKMLQECEQELGEDKGTAPNQDTDFNDPFSTSAALTVGSFTDKNGKVRAAALNSDTFTKLELTEVIHEADGRQGDEAQIRATETG